MMYSKRLLKKFAIISLILFCFLFFYKIYKFETRVVNFASEELFTPKWYFISPRGIKINNPDYIDFSDAYNDYLNFDHTTCIKKLKNILQIDPGNYQASLFLSLALIKINEEDEFLELIDFCSNTDNQSINTDAKWFKALYLIISDQVHYALVLLDHVIKDRGNYYQNAKKLKEIMEQEFTLF